MKIINNNPYRLLGVYSTSPQKDIVANQGKMKAFLKVGRQVSFSLDLNDMLPSVARTEESVADAASRLTLPAEQLRFAQFWFAKCTQLDEIACGKLTNGDMDGAIEIWKKKKTASSLQDLLMCSLIKGKWNDAISYAEELYSSYSVDFLTMVSGVNALANTNNLANDFLDALCEEIQPSEFSTYIHNNEWKEYVSKKIIQPIIERLSSALEECKSTRGKGATARLNAGTRLMNDTKVDLSHLRNSVSAEDWNYQSIADKLGTEILQCGIDYYNGSDDTDAAKKAMVLQSYAQSIVVGQMAKDRCDENMRILKKLIAELPPEEVAKAVRHIHDELDKFNKLPDKICHAVTLLNNTKPYLQEIKEKLGKDNAVYLKLSTLIVSNALHNLIEEVNEAQSNLVDAAAYDTELARYSRENVLNKLKSTLECAWKATLIIDTFDMESDFKRNRYLSQRKALKGICDSIGINTNHKTIRQKRESVTNEKTVSNKQDSEMTTGEKVGCGLAIIAVIAIFVGIIVLWGWGTALLVLIGILWLCGSIVK